MSTFFFLYVLDESFFARLFTIFFVVVSYIFLLHHILFLFFRYYDQLNALEVKIPVHEFQVPFKYKDAFDKGSIFGGKASLSKFTA